MQERWAAAAGERYETMTFVQDFDGGQKRGWIDDGLSSRAGKWRTDGWLTKKMAGYALHRQFGLGKEL